MGLEGHGQLPMACSSSTNSSRRLYFTRQVEETTQYETRAARPTPRLRPRFQGLRILYPFLVLARNTEPF